MIEPVRVTVRCVVRAFPDDPLAILIPSGCACLVRFRVFGFHALSVGHGVSRAEREKRGIAPLLRFFARNLDEFWTCRKEKQQKTLVAAAF